MSHTKRIDAHVVREAARGHWDMIFWALAEKSLGPALEAAGRRGNTHVACPLHGGKDGFRFFSDYKEKGAAICNTCGHFHDGFDLLEKVLGLPFKDVLRAVANVLGITPETVHIAPRAPRPVEHRPTKEELKNSAERRNAQRVWESAIPFTKENAKRIQPMVKYLKSRGLSFECVKELRFAPKATTNSNGVRITAPAMIAAIRDIEGNLVSVHRTFLTNDGQKAALDAPKKVMSVAKWDSISGSAIRFGTPSKVLALAEGIETALSVVKATRFACWSCVSAGGLKNVQIPDTVNTVFIYEDKDAKGAGQSAANALKVRLEERNIKVHIVEPPLPLEVNAKSVDFNDVWQLVGAEGFGFIRG